jgi:hypothetical protein
MAASAADGDKPHLGMEARLPRVPAGEVKKPGAKVWKGFVQGSLGAAIGGCCAHPLDLIKVRMQLQTEIPKKNMLQMGVSVFKNDGITGLFKGVDASAARQIVYSGVRFGMYDVLKNAAGEETASFNANESRMCSWCRCDRCIRRQSWRCGNGADAGRWKASRSREIRIQEYF